MNYYYYYYYSIWFISVVVVLVTTRSWWRRRRFPPGPYPLPVVGNLLSVGRSPHESLTKLSRKYGPLMSIHLGSQHIVVVSSPELAKEILQKHGQVFSGRPVAAAVHACDHAEVSIGFIPADHLWRDMRRICKDQMFSHGSLEASRGLRNQALQRLVDYARRCCDESRSVDIHEAAFITIVNLMSATLFSTQAAEFDSDDTQWLKENIEGVVSIVGIPNLTDFFPVLMGFDLQGIKRRAGVYLSNLLHKIEGYVAQRRLLHQHHHHSSKHHHDFLQTLLDNDNNSSDDNGGVTPRHLTHLMLDLLVGGSETTTTTIEWIMSTLVLNPEKMAKLREEVKRVVGEGEGEGEKVQVVEETEIGRLPYLQAVIKEVLRYNPAGPFLIPRKAEADQMVNGYLIPEGAQIWINAWGMGRDPAIWENPDSFEPERFLHDHEHHTVDYKGNHFELIPFGSGRRICPGMDLAHRTLHTTIATLVLNFHWELEPGATRADHRPELNGVSVRRAVPLRIIPSL